MDTILAGVGTRFKMGSRGLTDRLAGASEDPQALACEPVSVTLEGMHPAITP